MPRRRAVSPLHGSSLARQAKSTPAFWRISRERLRGLLVAVVEGARAADVVEVLGVRLVGERRDVEALGPVEALLGADAPRVRLRLHALEDARRARSGSAPPPARGDGACRRSCRRTRSSPGTPPRRRGTRCRTRATSSSIDRADDVLAHLGRLGAVAVALPADPLLDDLVLVLVEVVAQIEEQLARRERLARSRSPGIATSSGRTRCS